MKKRKKKPIQASRKKGGRAERPTRFSFQFKRIGLWLLLIALFFGVGYKLRDPQLLPIQTVIIEGKIPHTDKRLIQAAIEPFKSQNFFTLKMRDLKENLLQLPWIDSVFIAKEWPNRLRLTLHERQALAIWNNHAILDEHQQLFFAHATPFENPIPMLYGPEGEHLKVWANYEKFNTLLSRLHLHLTKLELSKQMTWTLYLNNGLRLVLDEQHSETRLKRFIKSYPALSETDASIDYVDLRYDHGMAVKYKETRDALT